MELQILPWEYGLQVAPACYCDLIRDLISVSKYYIYSATPPSLSEFRIRLIWFRYYYISKIIKIMRNQPWRSLGIGEFEDSGEDTEEEEEDVVAEDAGRAALLWY